MKKKNFIAILVILMLAIFVLFIGLYFHRSESKRNLLPENENSENVSPVSGIAADPVDEFFEKYPADSYLLVSTANSIFAPIPLAEDGSFKVSQANGSENVIHIGKNSFYMESSNCDNQNCVGQGEVTLENKDSRILFNMILCLPHELSLELLTPEEARSVLLELYAAEGSEVIVDAAE